jgi:hypothetical protein
VDLSKPVRLITREIRSVAVKNTGDLFAQLVIDFCTEVIERQHTTTTVVVVVVKRVQGKSYKRQEKRGLFLTYHLASLR